MQCPYFDYMASTPIHDDVVATMHTYLASGQWFANPHSNHAMGMHCQQEIERLSKQMLMQLGIQDGELIWTSGATESINLALRGAVYQYQASGRHIISLVTEHAATRETLTSLEKEGFEVTFLPVMSDGLLDFSVLQSAIRSDTILLSMTHVHNEIGCVQDIRRISDLCHQHGILVHLDCAQSIGKIDFHLPPHITFASFSAHKCYGPKGIGALLVQQRNRKLKKLLHGGSQQSNQRAGTLSLPLIAGMVKSFAVALADYSDHADRYRTLFRQFMDELHPSIHWNGSLDQRTPLNVNICLPDAVDLTHITHLKNEFALSNHSACNAKKTSHVLDALGLGLQQQLRTLRISMGYKTCSRDVSLLIQRINELVSSCD